MNIIDLDKINYYNQLFILVFDLVKIIESFLFMINIREIVKNI